MSSMYVTKKAIEEMSVVVSLLSDGHFGKHDIAGVSI
jgi:hypothetical protein